MLDIHHDLHPEVRVVDPGRVVVLNGASSSGKSSLAAALQQRLPGAWNVMAVDHVNRNRSRKEWTEEEFLQIHQRSILGFHRAVAAFASVGNDVIVDHVLGERWRYADLRGVLNGLPVTWVALHCDLPVLERREAERGNRRLGIAAAQAAFVHRGVRYDIEVDTTEQTSARCAEQVAKMLEC